MDEKSKLYHEDKIYDTFEGLDSDEEETQDEIADDRDKVEVKKQAGKSQGL